MTLFLIFSAFTTIYPERSEAVEDFFICGTFDTLPKDSIKIFINGKRVEGTLIYSGKVFTFIPIHTIRNGKKNVFIMAGVDTISQWVCKVKKQRKTPIFSGNFYTGTYTYLNDNPSDTTISPFNSYIGLNLTAFSKFTFKDYSSTKGFNNRISLGYQDSLFKINGLYINPKFSSLLLGGIYMNGIDLSIGKNKGVSFVISRKKGISKNSYIFGVNTYLMRNTFKSALGIARILDDTSITLPSDNLIFGAGLTGVFLGYSTNFSSALSFYTRDIYREALMDSIQFLKWIFYANKTTVPLNPLGLTSGAIDFKIHKGFRYIRFTRIGYSFVNNGISGIINDRISFTYRDRIHLNNRLNLFGGYNFWRNNLSHLNAQTRRYYAYNGGINIYGGRFEYQYSYTKAGDEKTPGFRYTVKTPILKFIGGSFDMRKFSRLSDIDYNIFLQNLPFSLSSKIYWHKISSNFWYGSEIIFQREFIKMGINIEEGSNSRSLRLESGVNFGPFVANLVYSIRYFNSSDIPYNYLRFNIQYYQGFKY